MKTPTTSRSAIVADDRALMRDLLRVALDELGIVTASEVSTGAAAIDAAAEHRPDVLILHEGTGLGGSEVIERIRCASPASTVVVLTSDRRETPSALAAAADAVVEEGGGLQDLPSVLGTGGGSEPPRRPTRRDRRTPDARGERWVKRLQGALAASILLLSILVILPSTGLDGGLAAAQESLGSLIEELPDATPEEAVSLATTLISHRAMLLSSDVDVTALDAEIAERIRPMLETLPGDVAAGVTAVLGDLLTTEGSDPPTSGAASTPGATTTAPDPTEAPANDPDATGPPASGGPASPTPNGPPSSTPSDSPTPSPSESPTPSPSESPTPAPNDFVQPTPADPPRGRPPWAGSGSDSAPDGGEPRGVGRGSGGHGSGP